MNHFYETIPGWTGGGLLGVYADIVKRTPTGGVVVEVGSWYGRSAAFMAVEIVNSGKNITFFCVDPWKEPAEHNAYRDMYDEFLANMLKGGVGSYVHPIELPSLEAVKNFANGSLDAVFLDGDHSYEAVKADISAWLPKVKPGGWLCGHDYHEAGTGVVKAVDELLPQRTVRELCWLVEV